MYNVKCIINLFLHKILPLDNKNKLSLCSFNRIFHLIVAKT